MKNFNRFIRTIAMAAALPSLLFSTGCIDEQLRKEIDDLKERVTSLESLARTLEEKIDAQLLVTRVSSSDDGHVIHFSDGSSIEINHGDDGSHGTTPEIEVKIDSEGNATLWINGVETCVLTGADGKDGEDGKDAVSPKIDVRPNGENNGWSIWYNITEGYPEQGWVNTGVKIADSNNDQHPISLIVFNYNGSVEFRLTDGSRYTFPLYSTAQHFEIMTTETEFDGSRSRRIVFRVNPSGASIPVGNGSDISRWALDLFETRASYVTPTEVFSLEQILPDGDKLGQYTATITGDMAAHDPSVCRYVMALVLDNFNGNPQLNSGDGVVSSGPFTLGFAPGAMLVSPLSIDFEMGGGTETVSVTTGAEWTATTSADWLSIEKSERSFTVTAGANSGEERSAAIRVENGTGEQTVAVVQKQTPAVTFVHASGSLTGDTYYGADKTNFFIEIQAYDPNAPQEERDGWSFTMNTIAPLADFTRPVLDLAPGTYTFIDDPAPAASLYTVDKKYYSSFRMMEDGYLSYQIGRDQPIGINNGGTMVVTGDHAHCTLTINLSLTNGTTLRGYYEGPLNIDNPEIESTFTEDRNLGSVPIYQMNYTANPYPSFPVDVFQVYGQSSGVSIENGTYRGSGIVALTQIFTALMGGSGEPMPDGTYNIASDFSAGSALAGGYDYQGQRTGTWIIRLENGQAADIAPIKSGTVTSVHSGGTYTVTVDGVDDAGNNIVWSFVGAGTGATASSPVFAPATSIPGPTPVVETRIERDRR